MKIYISYDMEGLSGAHHSDHMGEGRPEHPVFRRIGTQEINAAIEGAIEAGAESFVVNENHWTMKNILTEEIHPAAEYISGWNKRNLAMAGLDSTFDAAFLVGYHPKAGTPRGVLSHSLLGRQVHNIRLNGEPVGETAMSAALAGCYDVPIALVTGDLAVTEEAKALLGDVQTAAVKEGLDRFTAKLVAPSVGQQRIREAAKLAVERIGAFRPYKLSTPVTMEIEFTGVSMVTAATLIPGFKAVDGRTVSFTHDDFEVVYNALVAAAMLVMHPFVCDPDY
jgi:D-amino peptidase